MTHEIKKFRAEVTGIKEMRWSCNALTHDSVEEAESYLNDLSGRWFGFDLSRIVNSDVAKNQPVNLKTDVFYQNFRK